MSRSKNRLPEGTYIELVRSLFATRLPAAIMTLSFLMVGKLVHNRTPDRILFVLWIAGVVASAIRMGLLMIDCHRIADPDIGLTRVRGIERRFAASYLLFATILGMFGARVFLSASPDIHMLLGVLIVGYAAGVAAVAGLRPWLSVPSILIAVMPTVAVCGTMADPVYRVMAGVMTGLTIGGIRSIMTRYRSQASKITMRRMFSTLARQDHLTGLPNRLALEEYFGGIAGRVAHRDDLAVHCIDLDRFKPVNDRFGHPMGDLLLKAVANRLRLLLDGQDFAARLGGDEFVLVQASAPDAHAMAAMADRIARSLGEPYVLDGMSIVVGASVGSVLSCDRDHMLDRLIAVADAELYRNKQQRNPISPVLDAVVMPGLRLVG